MLEATKNDEPSHGADRLSAGGALLSLATGAGAAVVATLLLSLATSSFALLSFGGEVAFMLGVVGYLGARRLDVARVLRLEEVPVRVYWPALKLAVALLVANAAAATLLGPSTREMQLIAETDTIAAHIALAAGVVIAAPVIEEALFRGLLQRLLERCLHHWLAIVLTAVAFGALHGLESGRFLAFWALPLGWITWRSGSIRPAVVVHGLNNLLVFVLLLLARPGSAPEEVTRQEAALAVGALILMTMWAVSSCRQLAAGLEAGERAR